MVQPSRRIAWSLAVADLAPCLLFAFVHPVSGRQIVGSAFRPLSAHTADVRLGSGSNHCLVADRLRQPTVSDQAHHDTLMNVTGVGDRPGAAAGLLMATCLPAACREVKRF